MWYTFFKFTIFRPLVRFGWRATITGLENVPATGGAIIAPNHIANIDSIVIPALLQRRLTYPAKAELFAGKGFRGRIVAWFLRAIGQVPMDRSGGRASASSLDEITAVLTGGNLIGIYPEGTRSPDGRLYKGKTGVARMALQSRVPIIPVGVERTQSTRKVLGMGWPDRPRVIVGEPLYFDEFYADKSNAKVLRWVTDETMAAIQRLTGQEYADVYGFRVKHGDLKGEGSDAYLRPRPGGGEPPAAGNG
ncbi:MAG: lysophospholipid acyltransferase family protein [Propionibacteriaceae bacterium]|nr:lysophospholipid acyltransferase family protein [Propionibacteriaceae bacterium]